MSAGLLLEYVAPTSVRILGEVLAALHERTGIDVEALPEVREFARLVVEGWDL